MINPHKLVHEDPAFLFYAELVMQELTGMDGEQWVYELWKAYSTGVSPITFVEEILIDPGEDILGEEPCVC